LATPDLRLPAGSGASSSPAEKISSGASSSPATGAARLLPAPQFAQFIAPAWQTGCPLPKVLIATTDDNQKTIEDENMVKQAETAFFCTATISAFALSAVIAVQEFAIEPTAETSAAAPIVTLETAEIVGRRTAAREQLARAR